jgi:hypothetical protein
MSKLGSRGECANDDNARRKEKGGKDKERNQVLTNLLLASSSKTVVPSPTT